MYINGKIQISGHCPDYLELLKILFTKNRQVRLHDIEEFCNHGCHSAEMTGPGHAAQPPGYLCDLNPGLVTGQIYVCCIRHEQAVYPFGQGKRLVPFKITRVSVQIFRGTKLGGVHKQTYHHTIRKPACLFHKGKMTLMKKPHGWHKPHPEPFLFPGT